MRTPVTIALAASLALGATAVTPLPAFAQDEAAAPACPATEVAPAETPVEQPKKKKKKGFGLGGLISAARQAGLGDVLSNQAGGMFGGSKLGSIAGSVAGTAINAAEADHVDGRAVTGSLMGSSSAGKIAGAVTGTAIELASSARESALACGE